MEITWSKDQLKDQTGRLLTQSLILEFGYNDFAVFTINDDDKEYKGRVYPSLKKYYLDCEDPYEYSFATKCLAGWRHWQRLCKNKLFKPHIEEWREELEVKMMSAGLGSLVDQALDGEKPNFQAAKWLAEHGWNKRGAGRPSKAEKERIDNIQEQLMNELNENVIRMDKYGG